MVEPLFMRFIVDRVLLNRGLEPAARHEAGGIDGREVAELHRVARPAWRVDLAAGLHTGIPIGFEQEDNWMFHVIGWIIFGLIVGVIAKLIVPGRDPGGFVITAIIGIIGAVLAGWMGRAVGWYGPNDNAGFLMSILGAVILLVIYHALFRRRAVLP